MVGYFLPPGQLNPDNWPPDSNLYLYVFEQQHLIKCTGFIVKINLNNIYFLPRTIDPGQLTPVSNFCFWSNLFADA